MTVELNVNMGKRTDEQGWFRVGYRTTGNTISDPVNPMDCVVAGATTSYQLQRNAVTFRFRPGETNESFHMICQHTEKGNGKVRPGASSLRSNNLWAHGTLTIGDVTKNYRMQGSIASTEPNVSEYMTLDDASEPQTGAGVWTGQIEYADNLVMKSNEERLLIRYTCESGECTRVYVTNSCTGSACEYVRELENAIFLTPNGEMYVRSSAQGGVGLVQGIINVNINVI